ncbi:MAG: glycoside hydrolase family 66 protein [Acidimicrobiales bacterium]
MENKGIPGTDGGGQQRPFGDVRAFYRTGEEVAVATLPVGTARVVARRATNDVVEAELGTDTARFPGLGSGTYAVEALDAGGNLLEEELTTVGTHPGERPVHGFATSFEDHDVQVVLDWHRSLRSTVVQVYDWMASYTEPLGPESGWKDPSNRPVSFEALRALAEGLKALGAVAHAYAPVYAVGKAFAAGHPEMLMYRGDGEAIRFLDQIVLANPGNVDWQRHFVAAYGSAADAIGFDGFHVDTYGYPRVAHDLDGNSIDMRAAYESFLRFVRVARPSDMISFNQVNGVPSATSLPGGPGFRYCEVWPPNNSWRHLEGLLDRSSGRAGLLAPSTSRESLVRGSIACYPPVWGIDRPTGPVEGEAREASLRTVVSTEAVATCLGASSLIYGDRTAALCDPYYPKHARLTADEATTVKAWRHFALRCRDLFLDGEDTSWYEIDDENGAVAAEAAAPVRPEPVGGALFARVVHAEGRVTVGVVDLTGSQNGRWSEPTAKGSVSSVTLTVLLDHPERWRAEAAVLGAGGDRFAPLLAREVPHRRGRAVEVNLPIVSGWSVLRLARKRPELS